MTHPGPLRIMMTADAVGGVWTYATGLARELARRGHAVVLVTLGPTPRVNQLQAVWKIGGVSVEVTDLPLEWMEPEAAELPRALARLEAIARRVRPDVVHLNSFREAQGAFSAPVLVVTHSCVRSWWRACRGDDPAEPRWRRYAAHVAAGLAAADAWVAPTKAFRDTITALYRPASPGQVIHNGIDLPAGPRVKRPTVLAAGRLWDEAKNIGALAAIAPRLSWPVRLAGAAQPPGDARAADFDADCVELAGELTRARLLAEMQVAELFVAPALYEPFGLTVAEAAACGCALVLSDIASFRELWDGAALFVDPRDPDALLAALERLCRELGLRRRLRHAARRRAADYGLSVMAGAYEALYCGLATGNRVGSRAAARVFAEARA